MSTYKVSVFVFNLNWAQTQWQDVYRPSVYQHLHSQC